MSLEEKNRMIIKEKHKFKNYLGNITRMFWNSNQSVDRFKATYIAKTIAIDTEYLIIIIK